MAVTLDYIDAEDWLVPAVSVSAALGVAGAAAAEVALPASAIALNKKLLRGFERRFY